MTRLRITSSFAVVALVMGIGVAVTWGRTIIVTATICDRMAGISDIAPRQSWALYQPWPGTYSSTTLTIQPRQSFLFRFDLGEIPEGHRIAHAQLTLPVNTWSGVEPRFYLWRVLPDWGRGACHLYRKVERDQKIEWTKPGAAGTSSDRATRPTDIVRITEAGDVTINVTEDLDLWNTGAAPNHGWMLTVEDPGTAVHLQSPAYSAAARWKLRVTYEPQ